MKESGHYYTALGEPMHQVPKKDGKGIRATTIADCRKLNLLPSVTTIFKSLSKPELDKWKMRQVAKAALRVPKDTEFTFDEDVWVEAVIEEAFSQVGKAADKGTAIHLAIENHFQNKPYEQEYQPYIEVVEEWLSLNKLEFVEHEKRVVGDGYAGTLDGLVRSSVRQGRGVLDIKTRKTKSGVACTPWSTEPMQIAAYAKVENAAYGLNLYLSTTEIDPRPRIEATWYEIDQMKKEYAAFEHVKAIWSHFNKYVPIPQ